MTWAFEQHADAQDAPATYNDTHFRIHGEDHGAVHGKGSSVLIDYEEICLKPGHSNVFLCLHTHMPMGSLLGFSIHTVKTPTGERKVGKLMALILNSTRRSRRRKHTWK